MNPIYEFIASRSALLDKHIEELKVKRGFTDETIKRGRFFSGGNQLLSLEKELTDNLKNCTFALL